MRPPAHRAAAVAAAVVATVVLGGCAAGGAGSNSVFQTNQLPTATSTLVVGTARQGTIEITGARVVRGTPARVYMTVRTTDGKPDTVTGLSTSAAAKAGFVAADGSAQTSLAVPATGVLVLGPSGPAGVITDATLDQGTTVALTLTFARAGMVTVFAHVLQA